MGWHVVASGDRRYLTAGHCTVNSTNANWYHQGYQTINGTGFIGQEIATLYQPGGKDVMIMGLPDAHASKWVYGQTVTDLGAGSLPIVGEVVCASMAASNAVNCGTVSDDWLSWTSDLTGWTVWGADLNGFTPIVGDSGSPVYKRTVVPGEGTFIYPKGVLDHEDGYFARITDALSGLSATLYRP